MSTAGLLVAMPTVEPDEDQLKGWKPLAYPKEELTFPLHPDRKAFIIRYRMHATMVVRDPVY
jgi:hypothetical protein